METRANYVLIGTFALAGFLGILGFFLWFAQFQLDQKFDYYDARFTSVSGLSRASDVRFSGLPVGQVVSVQLSPEGDGTVVARLEVEGGTPIRTDSVATIESMGVTGVSYVGITAGDPDAALLNKSADAAIPEIQTGRSVIQTLTEGAPKMIEEAVTVMDELSTLLGDENQQKVQTILDNLVNASGELSRTLEEFSGISDTVAGVSRDIAAFTEQLDPVITSAQTTLTTLDETLNSATKLAGRVETSLDEADATLQSGRGALDAAQGFITGDLRDVTRDLRETMDVLRDRTDGLVSDARGMIGEFSAAGSAATARLTEARDTLQSTQGAIESLVETLDSIDKAAVSFDGLITDDGTALVSETRSMIETASSAVSSVNKVAETDLPVIVADIRGATETVNRVVAQVGANLSDTTGRIDGRIDGLADEASKTMAQVTETFANANDTLTAIDTAMTTGERTLNAAERVFDDVDRVMNEDVDAITGDLRRVLQQLDGAIARVSDDIPVITGDLRDAAEAASRAFDEVGQMVAQAGPPVREFTTTGLQQYTQVARETRDLIANLERLARQIERDPARFFLNRQTPEFRR